MFLKTFWKEVKEHTFFIKCFTLAFVGSGAGWVYYEINKTRQILENALDTSVLQTMNQYIVCEESVEDNIVEIEPFLEYNKRGIVKWVTDSIKFAYARRLLSVAKDSNQYYRIKAVNKLAGLHNLDDWHCALIANMIDPRTAVALARTSNADSRYFLGPPYRYHNYEKDQLIHEMREFLISVYEQSDHPCMGYFLSKAFVYDDDNNHIVDDASSSLELSKFIQSEKEVLPMCLESLLHHCSIENYSKDIADLNGLPLLMEIYRRYSDDINVSMRLSQILSLMSYNRNLLEPFCKSGWIGVLAQWANHSDIRISIPAARTLANLDADNDAHYSSNLYVLHPVNRTKGGQHIDVIFVHGLLGGVFFTWRQRKIIKSAFEFTKIKKGSEMPDSQLPLIPQKKKNKWFLKDIIDKIIHDEYELVWNDIPLNVDDTCLGPFSCPEEKLEFGLDIKTDDAYTYCWPKDWLSRDCKNVRIIGINYETSLSMWTPLCPLEKDKFTLNERSDEIAHKLLKSDVGKRPIVWITHSMGGLIVKRMLLKASESEDPNLKNIYLNTRGVVFYSTPHQGSKMANLSNAISLILWPSVEVQELKENSPELKKMHEQFLDIIEKIPVRVITFVETKSTVVSAMKFNFLLVEPKSGNTGIGEYYEIPLDHLGICKPRDRNSFLYQKIVHLLKEVMQEAR